MRAGKLDKVISIEYPTASVSESGKVTDTWALVAVMRARIVKTDASEAMYNYGEGSERVITFRIRYIDGLSLDYRINYNTLTYDIVDLQEIGRRRELQIRCIERGTP